MDRVAGSARMGGDFDCRVCGLRHNSAQVCVPWPIQKAQMALEALDEFVDSLNVAKEQKGNIYKSLSSIRYFLNLVEQPITRGWQDKDESQKGVYKSRDFSLGNLVNASILFADIASSLDRLPMDIDQQNRWKDIFARIRRDVFLKKTVK